MESCPWDVCTYKQLQEMIIMVWEDASWARGGLRNFSHEALLLHCPAEGTSLPARACRACPPHNPRAPSCIRGQGHFGARDGRGACRIHWQCMQDSLAAESSERSLAVYRPASQLVKTVRGLDGLLWHTRSPQKVTI